MALDNSGTFLIANAVLDALHPSSGTTTVGTKTITAPIRVKCCTTQGSATAPATEITPGNSYVSIATATTGGISIGTNWAAAASGSKATNAVVSRTDMPAATISHVELYDNTATPLRIDWENTFTQKTTSAGDTLSFASGQITVTLS